MSSEKERPFPTSIFVCLVAGAQHRPFRHIYWGQAELPSVIIGHSVPAALVAIVQFLSPLSDFPFPLSLPLVVDFPFVLFYWRRLLSRWANRS